MSFQGFQNYYIKFKQRDINLFNTFDIINDYLQQLFGVVSVESLNAYATSAWLITLATASIPGLSLVLTTPGRWLIILNYNIIYRLGDGFIQAWLVINGKQVNSGFNDQIFVGSPDDVPVVGSSSWIYKSTKANDVVTVQILKTLNGGISAVNQVGTRLTAVYLGV